MMDMDGGYVVPTSLNVLAGIFLGVGALLALIVAADIVWRRGWKTMMLIMIPVFPINAGYMPLSVYVYYKYGRPPKPGGHGGANMGHDMKHGGDDDEKANMHSHGAEHGGHQTHDMSPHDSPANGKEQGANPHSDMHHHMPHENENADHAGHDHAMMHHHPAAPQAPPAKDNDPEAQKQRAAHAMHSMHGPSPDRPMWATVSMGVMHCGAGCVLGDIVGEWVVWGSGATIHGSDVWPCLLVDYAFALLFGIAFQYFSIAPMTGDYGLKTVWRAAKADFLSLTFFEIGLFGWMVAYQVGIWGYRLGMDTWVYWWMMQVGMFLGFWTAFPINWWLIKVQIKV